MSIQIPRTEPPFVVLALAGGGEFTRLLTAEGIYRIWLDAEPAPEDAYWWLSVFEKANLIRWEKLGDAEFSRLTHNGRFVLKKRHREILGPPKPDQPEAPPCHTDLDLDNLGITPYEAARIRAAFLTLDQLHREQNGPTS